ncbi:MAG: hypothetical protein K6G89_06035 [Clostridia bacterium]|nr:hypothetical protein [Clostridia bacterium]
MADYNEERTSGGENGSFSVGAEKKRLAEYKAALEELGGIVNSMKEVGFSNKKGQIDNPARLRELVEILDANLPEAIDRAHDVLDNAMTIVNSANKMKVSLDDKSAKLDADIKRRRAECEKACEDAIEAANSQAEREAEAIINEAKEEAAAIVANGKREQAVLVAENTVTAAAREEAARYLKVKKDEADNYSNGVHNEADAYADAVRKRVEADKDNAYQRLREVVNGNLQMLEKAYTDMEREIKGVFDSVHSNHSRFLDEHANKK